MWGGHSCPPRLTFVREGRDSPGSSRVCGGAENGKEVSAKKSKSNAKAADRSVRPTPARAGRSRPHLLARGERVYRLLRDAPPVLIILELVETGACRG